MSKEELLAAIDAELQHLDRLLDYLDEVLPKHQAKRDKEVKDD